MQQINPIKSNTEFSIDEENKKYNKVRDHCHYIRKYGGAAHICNLRYKTPKQIPVVLHYGSTYDYHFLIKEPAEEFIGQFKCLGENTEKHVTFSVPIEKELDNGKAIKYKIECLYLCQAYYQILLIIYLKDFIMISAQIVNLVLSICQSKIIN